MRSQPRPHANATKWCPTLHAPGFYSFVYRLHYGTTIATGKPNERSVGSWVIKSGQRRPEGQMYIHVAMVW